MKTAGYLQLFVIALAVCVFPHSAWAGQPSGASAEKQKESARRFKEGELLVKFRPSVGESRIEQIRNVRGLRTLKHFRELGVYHMRITTRGLSVEEAAKLLSNLPEVAIAEPNYEVSIDAIPNDPLFGSLWGLHNTGQTGGTPDADIDAPEAWDFAIGDPNMVVAVIDTGVDYNHPDLAGNMWTNPGEIPGNGEDDDSNGYVDDVYGIDAINNDSDPFDDNGHGTHTSGTIGAIGNNGIGVAGVNWNIRIMALKFLGAGGSGSTSDAIECLNYAVMMKTTYGVDLKATNNSWGGGGYSQTLRDAIEASGNADMLFIASAGNLARNNDLIPYYPASYDLANIMAVAATDHNDALASFSSYGATSVDLAAPGVSILSTTPGTTYSSYSGTSMAAPHVAGASALVWADNPALGHLDVKEILMNNVDPVPALAGRMQTGGRLNVFESLTCDPSVVSLVPSLGDGFVVEQGEPLALSARLSACAPLTGATVTASFNNGDPAIALLDDGLDPDGVANDGTYTGLWMPSGVGPTTVTFTAVHDGDTYVETATGDVLVFFGYFYDDTVPFAWIDISATGTPLSLSDDDNAYFALPFPIRFFDVDYDYISVGSNGHVYFENIWSPWNNSCIPSDTGYANTFVAGLWDDLNPSGGGQVYWEIRGAAPNRTAIVQYAGLPHYPVVGAVHFEIIFYEDSDSILMQYLDTDFGNPVYNSGASATVGVQRDPAYGQQYSCNSPAIPNATAILWYRTLPGTPEISLNPMSLANSAADGTDAPDQTFEVWNSGTGTLTYSISDDVGWLACSPPGGTSTGEHDTITVSYSTAALAAGSYSATITVTDPAATNDPQTISVSLTIIEAPEISLSPTSLSNSTQEGADAPDQSFEVWNSGTGTLMYSISDDVGWLACSPPGGSSAGEHDTITVSYSTAALAAGPYSATITVTDPSATNDPQTIPVSLTVVQAPAIALNPTSLNNSAAAGSDAPDQSFEVWNSGGGTLTYSISDDVGWLACSPPGGTSTGEHDTITVSYTTSLLAAGSYSATITVTDPAAANDPQTVPVSLTVTEVTGELARINLVAPADMSVFASPPTFVWNADGGTGNVYSVDLAYSPSGPFWTTQSGLGILLDTTTWTPPASVWNMIGAGRRVYWRVRGADLDASPMTIITSDELWSFTKQ